MHTQSTAQMPRRAQRGPSALLVALAIATVGTGVGVAAYAIVTPPAPPTVQMEPDPVAAPPVAPTTATRPTPADPLAIGMGGSFDKETLVWVDETGLWAFNRAFENRDTARAMDTYNLWQHVNVAPGTRLVITNRRGGAFQVEILDGPLAGRRGWTDYGFSFVPLG